MSNTAEKNTPETPQLSVTGRLWQWRTAPNHIGTTLSQKLGVPEVVGRILATRVTEPAAGRHFMAPSLADLPDPSSLKGMDAGADRLAAAIENREKIYVFGDYDVDGSCGSALLMRYFHAVAGDASTDVGLYIPDRMSEGYGPNPGAMEKIAADGGKVIVTVDTGSVAFEAFEKARELGLEVIITDHHQTRSEFPPCVALINPNRMDETTEHTNLAGAGVAFMLLLATNRQLRERGYFKSRQEPDLRSLLDLVAIASVCDMVPLTGINRILVDRGLKVMAQRRNIGLTALADIAGLDSKPSTYHAGFLVGPRINAGGRIGACDLGANLLLCDEPGQAQQMAARLHSLNEERKEIEAQVLAQAMDKAHEMVKKNAPAMVVAGEGWHPGVIGIVASRIKEVYHRPVFVISFDEEGVGKGSGRSVTGIDLGKAVAAARGHLESGGGHKMAAGLTVFKDKFPAFLDAFNKEILRQAEKADVDVFTPCLKIDGSLVTTGATLGLLDAIEQLEPYGAGNPEPRFVFPGVRADGVRVVGENHLKCRLTHSAGKGYLDAIAFRAMGNELGPWLMNTKGRSITLCGKLRRNVWQGRETVQLQIDDGYDGTFK